MIKFPPKFFSPQDPGFWISNADHYKLASIGQNVLFPFFISFHSNIQFGIKIKFNQLSLIFLNSQTSQPGWFCLFVGQFRLFSCFPINPLIDFRCFRSISKHQVYTDIDQCHVFTAKYFSLFFNAIVEFSNKLANGQKDKNRMVWNKPSGTW